MTDETRYPPVETARHEARPWRVRMLAFVAYIRTKGHHYTWMHTGQVARPIGLCALKFHCNDNQRGQVSR